MNPEHCSSMSSDTSHSGVHYLSNNILRPIFCSLCEIRDDFLKWKGRERVPESPMSKWSILLCITFGSSVNIRRWMSQAVTSVTRMFNTTFAKHISADVVRVRMITEVEFSHMPGVLTGNIIPIHYVKFLHVHVLSGWYHLYICHCQHDAQDSRKYCNNLVRPVCIGCLYAKSYQWSWIYIVSLLFMWSRVSV